MGDIAGIKTAAGYELQWVMNWGGGVTADPDPKTCSYQHFDLSSEQLGRTGRYNCWGFTFLPRRYWINSPDDVDHILADNCTPVADGLLHPGDVIRYRDSAGVTTHTGRVWQVDAGGHCVKVRSKWGGWAEYVHDPLDVPTSYGTNLAYFRQHAPLQGVIGDLFVHDANSDSGEQCSPNQWTSPDIVVDAPPYGSVDVNPVFGQVNRVWAVVSNRSQATIANARVRYYWANPFVGFVPSTWNLIPGTPGHPNPTDPFSVPGGAAVQAPYVEWTPAPVPGVPDPAHQCLLAIAYINDDPKDSSNPDPLVYPFDIRWDNNIAARNVHVVTMKTGKSHHFTVLVGMPHEGLPEAATKLRLRLFYVPRLPILGYPRQVAPLQVTFTLGREKPVAMEGLMRPMPLFGMTPVKIKQEILLSMHELNMKVTEGKPRQLHINLIAPKNATTPANYYLSIEQVHEGAVTGAYLAAITVK